MKKKLKWLVGLIMGVFLFSLFTNYRIAKYSKYCYEEVDDIPHRKVGLLLGAIKTFENGRINPCYKYRLEAAIDLYKAGKVSYILVSGCNTEMDPDNLSSFQIDLEAAGVAKEHIYIDSAGFRTLDSVVRCNKVFGERSFTVISQSFHNKRALFLADAYELDAIGFNGKETDLHRGSRGILREYLARFKAFLDIYILHTSPKLLDAPIRIG